MPIAAVDHTNRAFNDYYQDVGKYSLLDAVTEHDLILRYKTCKHCSKTIPQKIRRKNCPECGEEVSTRFKSRIYTCDCNAKYDVYVVPSYCPFCGADRDYTARDRLVTANLRFVVKTAKTFTKNNERLLSLISAGNIGLMLALDKFDLSLQTRFLTYAAWWVRKEMLDEINANSIVHLPSHKQKERRKVFKQQLYVCRHCDLQIDKAQVCGSVPPCVATAHDFLPVTVDDPLSTVFSIDKVILATSDDMEEDMISEDTAQTIRRIIHKLNLRQRDKFIIMQYYNISSSERRSSPKSLKQLSELAGVTPERVRQIKERTLKDLRMELKRRSITSLRDVC